MTRWAASLALTRGLLVGLCVCWPSYTSAEGTERDPSRDQTQTADAVEAIRRVAEQGDAVAQYTLGFMYAYGEGVSQDDVAAHSSQARRPRARHLVHVRRHAPMDPAQRQPHADPHGQVQGGALRCQGEANAVFTELGLPTTFLLTSFYWENLIYFGMGPKKGTDGRLAITFPMGDKKLPSIAAEDIGKCAYGIFKKGREFIGKTVGVAGEHLTGAQMAAALTKALGQEVRYNDVPPEVYRGFGFPGAEDLGNMFQFNRDFEQVYSGARNLDLTRALNPSLQTFDGWLAHNKSRIPLE